MKPVCEVPELSRSNLARRRSIPRTGNIAATSRSDHSESNVTWTGLWVRCSALTESFRNPFSDTRAD